MHSRVRTEPWPTEKVGAVQLRLTDLYVCVQCSQKVLGWWYAGDMLVIVLAEYSSTLDLKWNSDYEVTVLMWAKRVCNGVSSVKLIALFHSPANLGQCIRTLILNIRQDHHNIITREDTKCLQGICNKVLNMVTLFLSTCPIILCPLELGKCAWKELWFIHWCARKHTQIKAESRHFNLIVAVSFQIQCAGAQSQKHKTCVTVLILSDCSVHVCERWWREKRIWAEAEKHVCVGYHYTNCTTKSHTGSVWLKPMDSTCLSYFKGDKKTYHIIAHPPSPQGQAWKSIYDTNITQLTSTHNSWYNLYYL